jgi:3-dehydroquinate synthase
VSLDDTQDGSPAEQPLAVRSRVRDYVVEFDHSTAWVDELAALENSFVIVDENVLRLHGGGALAALDEEIIVSLPISEEHKTLEAVSVLAVAATKRAAKRNCVVVSIGGGITQDVTGYLASTLYRGVRWIYAPTTLLAMADSCIGGKTSLNLGSHKNLLGTMYPPERVIVHAPFVTTLADRDFASGLGEIVKLHLLGGAQTLARLRAELPALLARDLAAVRRATRAALEIKREFIEEDEFDRGRRNLLNYGHCFGHALETTMGFAVPHGQAVVVGMLLADRVAESRGLLGAAATRERRDALYLPVMRALPRLDGAAATRLVEAMKFDKKRTGAGLALVMVGDGLSATRVDDLSAREALDALALLSAGESAVVVEGAASNHSRQSIEESS